MLDTGVSQLFKLFLMHSKNFDCKHNECEGGDSVPYRENWAKGREGVGQLRNADKSVES